MQQKEFIKNSKNIFNISWFFRWENIFFYPQRWLNPSNKHFSYKLSRFFEGKVFFSNSQWMITVFRHLWSSVDRRWICFPDLDSISIAASLVTGLQFNPDNKMTKSIILRFLFIFIIFEFFIFESLIDFAVFMFHNLC